MNKIQGAGERGKVGWIYKKKRKKKKRRDNLVS